VGAVVNINSRREHKVIESAKQVLLNLHHRGAAGADNITGDGAGILFQIPHEFFVEALKDTDIRLGQRGTYGVAQVFGSKDPQLNQRFRGILENAVSFYQMRVLGWRDVPSDPKDLGEIALSAEPHISQLFIDGNGLSDEALERKLYMARKRAEKQVAATFGEAGDWFYVCSMSCRTINYKGMFMAYQLFSYYPDLSDELCTSAMAIVHQRYSTNTFPSWKLAQPFRCLAHNGEINTLSGNVNKMRAREQHLSSDLFGDDIEDLFPVVTEGGSDSACFDNGLELLIRGGRSLPHSMMMMIPEAFGTAYHISTDKRAFYEYHTTIMEPWDGPASMVFTDGRYVGGTLDRNGLRPSRYVVTTDGLVVLASEVGVIEFPPERIQTKGRLQPGRMFLVDLEEKRIVTDNEIKSRIVRQKPYRRWLDQNRIELRGLFSTSRPDPRPHDELMRMMRAFGYTREDCKMILVPMALNGQEPLGSMGNDTPLSVLSDHQKSLFSYFKQLFAQVTNPPIDPYREVLVMSLMSYTGRQSNLLEETPQACRQLKLPHPILTNEDVERLRSVQRDDFSVATVDMLFDAKASDSAKALREGIDRMLDQAEARIRQGASLLILSDRNVDADRAAIPALLATSAMHHGLLERRLRAECGLLIESGEPREVQDFCLLVGFGANAINPYLAFETIEELRRQKITPATSDSEQLVDNYITAIKKGILKTMSKMGISTVRSYQGAQLFECVGINSDVVNKYFKGTSSRIGGVGLGEIAREALLRHTDGFGPREPGSLELDFGGEYAHRVDGERHAWNPVTVTRLQHAVVNEDFEAYKQYSQAVWDQSKKIQALRGLLEFQDLQPVPLEEVESAEEIAKRFYTGAISHGSISKEAHECMAIAMNRLGAMANTGEGGEDPARYIPEANGDSKSCGVKQVASGRFGVTINYLSNARMVQIKMAQGAKPGEGGQLPGHKVSDEIAGLRFSTPGVTLISPPPHHDIYSIEDLKQLIYDLKCSSPGAGVSVKLVSEVGVGTVAAGVAKGNADEVLISGYDGGTGASPLSSIKHAGLPWELGVAETQQVLVQNNLRDRIFVQCDGQLKTGRDVVIAALLGAEKFGFGTGTLVAMGCILMRKCHLGTCPVGIATQDKRLRKRFAGRPEYITRFMLYVAQEARELMAQLGFRTFEEMVGRMDKLNARKAIDHWKAKGLDLSPLLTAPDASDGRAIRRVKPQKDEHEDHLDWQILDRAGKDIEAGESVKLDLPVRNVHRTVGTILSNRVVKTHGPKGLPDSTVELTLRGSAGQSFGAWLAPGITLRLIGDANDYLGKGLSGGRIIVQTPEGSPFVAHENIIVGNVLFYGATGGEAFINGMAGERFAVRNSGVTAVVEGVGDHGCEYMTGGVVVVLGETGRNFAAGMSGGIAYVLDEHQLFDTLCNLDMVDLENVWHDQDVHLLQSLIRKHYDWTGSHRAKQILDNWSQMIGRFVKVMPIDYRKALERMREREDRQQDMTPATEEVFRG
jgi:glutamate synthase domain-containing protein 2/glutamate synthase domain-containing protein 1/glutamate synthase domain-containing protein 3